MIPILFNKDEKTFTSLGLGQMDATLVEVERERNGNYTLYAEVPFNSPQAKHLTKEMLIKADAGARTKWQTFKINRTIKDTNADVIKVYADHISMDTINDAMNPKVVIRQQTAEGALRQWANNLVSGKAYDVQSDITHVGSTEWTIDEVENARQALGGVSGSILDVWGGEYEFDNNTIILHKEMGRTAPTVLEYGRNIVSLEYEELIDGVYTSIYPYATYTPKSEDNKQLPDIMVTLDELIVDSEYAGNYETRRIQIVDFSNEFDSNAENPEIPTQAKLRTLAKAYVNNNGYGIPKISQEIDFVDLSKTLDYQDIQVMEEIELNDRVPVYYPNIDAETNDVKVTTTNWDVLNNRYSKITLSTIGAMNSNSITSKLSTAIKDLKAEQKKINNTVPYLINGQGNRVWWTTPDENMEHKIDDTWFKKNGKYTIIYKWNGSMWEEVLNDETFITEIEAGVSTAQEEAEKAVQSAKDADTKAQSALTKAGVNANLLTTHQNTLDTIKNTTIPNVNKVASDAMAEAKSALSSASSAMDEAKKADGKIADYVTTKGLVSGTTVDSKINTATGEINKKITTVESKIPTSIGGRNYYARETTLSVLEAVSSLTKAHDINGFKATGGSSGNKRFRMHNVIKSNGDWTISGYFRGTQNTTVSFNVNLNDLVDSEWFKSTTDNTWKYFEFSGNVTNQSTTYNFINFHLGAWAHYEFKDIKVEKGTIATDWSPAPEDNYTQEEFAIFESTYNEDVKGINSSLTELSNKKLDGTTYTDFYTNEYKKTAQGVTDTYAKVNKIIDANGNSTDAFAKAVYDRNATRQSADFKEVTKDLVTTAIYSEGVKGINQSITTIRGDLDKLSVGGRNLIDESMITSTVSSFDKSEYVTKGLITYSSSGGTVGLRINASKLEPNTDYVVSYKYKKTGGTLLSFGGHVDTTFKNNLAYVDGSVDGVDYFGNKSVYVNDDTKTHSVVVKFTTPNTVTPTDLFYIQPNRSTSSQVSVNIFDWQLEKGTIPTDWSPAPEDMLGKADFQVFKGTYENNDQAIKNRLTAIDSGKQGSIAYNANEALSTAQGNTRSITTLDTKVNNLKVGGRNYFKNSDVERTGSREFVNHYTWNMSPVINEFGTDTYYTVSFDIKSKVAGNINVYTQNGNGTKYTIGTKTIYVPTTYKRFSYTFKPELSSSTETMSMLAFFGTYESGRIPTIKNVKFEVGNFATDWTPAPEDMLGKETFTLFKNEYEDTSSKILNRLTAIDSSAEGSVVTRLNKTESTASGNSQLISTINKNYVKQSNIDASILADKKIKDTRSTNQSPSWYFTNYPLQEVREFKQVPTMGIGSGTYGILTTNVPWRDDSGGTVKQKFETNTETHVRQSNSAGTAWGAWSKQIDTADTTYQKITQTSSLYERVIGSTEANVKNNMARIVMADSIFKTEVIDKTNVDDSNTFSSSTNVSILTNIGRIVKDDPLTTNGFLIVGAQGNNGSVRLHNVITSNGWWTVSGWARGSQNADMKFAIDICDSPHSKQFGLGTKNEWQYFEFSHNVTNYSSARNFVDFNSIAWAYYYFKDIKVEKNHHATAWTPSASDFATQSHITQLSDNINLKVSKGDISNQININSQGVVIKGNKIALSGDTTVDGTFWTKQVNAVKVNASNITTGTLNASKVTVTNIDANNITANKSSFVQTVWNSLESSIRIDGGGLLSTASDKSQVYLQNGVVGARNPSGATIGQIGYAYETSSPWYSMQISHGSHFQIRMSRGDGQLNKQAFYIISGGAESYLNTDNIYLNPSSAGRVRVQGDMAIDKNLSVGNEISGTNKLRFAKGAYLEEQSNGNTQLKSAGTQLQFYQSSGRIMYSDGTRLFLDLSINMQGNGVLNQSDARMKTDIRKIEQDSLSIIKGTDFVNYKMISNGRETFGFIAQQVQEIAPHLIKDEDGTLAFDSMEWTQTVAHGLQQLDNKVDDEVAQLKAQVASLQEELAQLKGD